MFEMSSISWRWEVFFLYYSLQISHGINLLQSVGYGCYGRPFMVTCPWPAHADAFVHHAVVYSL